MSERVPHPFEPEPARLLTGSEELAPGLTVRDFWSWGFSDLRLNTTRGLLAEYLVARALGDERSTAEGWGNFDVLTPDGIRVEVKAAGYLQSWRQTKPSAISFGRLTGRSWTDAEDWSVEREIRADVFVFAVHTCVDHAIYDVLDLSAWQFYVVPAHAIRSLGVRSLSLPTVRAHSGGPVSWHDLRAAVQSAATTR